MTTVSLEGFWLLSLLAKASLLLSLCAMRLWHFVLIFVRFCSFLTAHLGPCNRRACRAQELTITNQENRLRAAEALDPGLLGTGKTPHS